MNKSGQNDTQDQNGQPGQQTDTGTGHGVKGQGGQELSKGVPAVEGDKLAGSGEGDPGHGS